MYSTCRVFLFYNVRKPKWAQWSKYYLMLLLCDFHPQGSMYGVTVMNTCFFFQQYYSISIIQIEAELFFSQLVDEKNVFFQS